MKARFWSGLRYGLRFFWGTVFVGILINVFSTGLTSRDITDQTPLGKMGDYLPLLILVGIGLLSLFLYVERVCANPNSTSQLPPVGSQEPTPVSPPPPVHPLSQPYTSIDKVLYYAFLVWYMVFSFIFLISFFYMLHLGFSYPYPSITVFVNYTILFLLIIVFFFLPMILISKNRYQKYLRQEQKAKRARNGRTQHARYSGGNSSLSGVIQTQTTMPASTLFKPAPISQERTREQWLGEGERCWDAKRYEESIFAYEQVIRLDPTYAHPYQRKGDNLFYLKRYDEAIDAFEQAIQLGELKQPIGYRVGTRQPNPDNELAYSYAGKSEALKKLGRRTEAKEALVKARQLGYRY